MSFDRMREFCISKPLSLQLQSFGLNPQDWRLKPTHLDEYLHIEMVHKTDRNFRFNGTIDYSAGGELKLDYLKLASL